MKVVVAQRDKGFSQRLCGVLEGAGHEVVAKPQTAQDIVSEVMALQPSCTFVCVEFLSAIAQLIDEMGPVHIPCFMVTVSDASQLGLVHKAMERGASGCIGKDFADEEILMALEAALVSHESSRDLEERILVLEDKLETRKLLDRAKGILISRGLTEEEAFVRLRKAAMDTRKSLKEVAEAVVLNELFNG